MLRFNSDGKFGMLLFGDLHEKPDYKTSPNFRDMQKLMNAALDEFRPEICVFLGDNFSTGLCAQDPEAFRQAIADLCEPATSRGIPVYAIMGNHEHDPGVDEAVVSTYDSLPLVNMRCDGVPGKADYYEVLYSSQGNEPKAVLWFLDSNNLCDDQSVSKYDWVHTDQIEWFEKTCNKLSADSGRVLPSYIFQHTPVPEEYRLLRKARLCEYPVSVRGHNKLSGERYVGAEGTVGYVGEGPCSPDFNNGQFESWKRAGGVKAAFFGHDHLNDFSGYVDGIFLAQHKTAGFRAYTDGCRSCVRYVELNESSPDEFTQVLKHFKEFGLRSESLGPVFRTITDRQSMALHFCARALGAAAALTAAAYTVYHFSAGGKTNGKK